MTTNSTTQTSKKQISKKQASNIPIFKENKERKKKKEKEAYGSISRLKCFLKKVIIIITFRSVTLNSWNLTLLTEFANWVPGTQFSTELWFFLCTFVYTMCNRLHANTDKSHSICPTVRFGVSRLTQQNLIAQLRKHCRHQKTAFLDEHMTEVWPSSLHGSTACFFHSFPPKNIAWLHIVLIFKQTQDNPGIVQGAAPSKFADTLSKTLFLQSTQAREI